MSEFRRRFALPAFVAASALAVVAGCASIPTSGDPQIVKAEGAPAQSDAEVRVIAQGPRSGDSPISIVSGFLEASGTTEEGFATARKFLTPASSTRWDARGITVYDQARFSLGERSGDRVVLSTVAVGRVDDQGVYTPEPGERSVSITFQLVRSGGDWRIDEPPSGLLVSRQDFEREYLKVDNYFVARPPRTSVLVPDPIYLPRASTSPTARLEALLRGPSRWLDTVAMTALPTDAALAEPINVLSGVALVRLTPESVPIEGVQRDLMLAQIVQTLMQDPEVSQVEVRALEQPPLSFGGAGNPVLRRADVVPYLPADQRPPPAPAYFVRDGAAYLSGEQMVQGPIAAETELAEIAVSPGGGLIAGVSTDRTTLVTGRADDPKRLVSRAKGTNLRSLSFDGDGNLWVVSGEGSGTAVLRYPPSGPPQRVRVDGFEPRQILRLRVAADGVRLALVLDTVRGTQVYVAQSTEDTDGLEIAGPRRMAGQLTGLRSVDWMDSGRLVVLGSLPDGQLQPFEVQLGGPVRALAGTLPGVTEISAAYGQPLMAATKKQIYRLREDGAWLPEGLGTAVTYPG
ncbi:LpqB family beta-propeller domain-containing protein [Sporichthya polymorpha]|uniref:LpqB family beta-propeller domain-containing protein n=1 Tax=Sporichthya polymorpha TaxID=35751 RepID=UPI00036864BB|nr:LpqB family beta-propeller domain-containing protein [Sporichthya polymorpha]